MKKTLSTAVISLFLGCSSHQACHCDDAKQETRVLAWEEWSSQMLLGSFGANLPRISAEGWSPEKAGSWVRSGAQIADYNLDGRIDYLRIVDPPGSYVHHIWVDRDNDGYFEPRSGENEESKIGVPNFEPANPPLQRTAE